MPRRNYSVRSLHRWFSVVVGIAFSVWVASGLVMILGFVPTANGISTDRPQSTRDLTAAVISPSEAVARAAATLGVDEPVMLSSIQFRRVGTRRVYDMGLQDIGSVFVDIETGEIVRVDTELARELAVSWMLPEHEIVEEHTLESYDLWYPRGSLPAYRFVFDNGTRVHVRTTGEVILVDRTIQAYHGIVGLHDFSVLGSVFRIGFGHWLLWAASLASIVVIATGYLLAYPWLTRSAQSARKT